MQDIELLNEVVKRVSKAQDIDSLLAGVQDVLLRIFNAQIVAFWMPDPLDPSYLILRCSEGLPPEAEQQRWSVEDEGIISTIKRIGATFFSQALYRDERLKHRDVIVSWGIKHMIAVPLTSQQQIIGVLMIARRVDREFQESQLLTLKIASTQIGLGIGENQLMFNLRRQTRLMNDITKIASNLAELIDRDKIYNYVTMAAHQDLGYEVVSLWLREGSSLIPYARAMNQKLVSLSSEQPWPVTQHLVKQVLRSGHSAVENNINLNSNGGQDDDSLAVRSALTVPLRFDMKVVGTITAMSREFDRFDEIDRLTMEALAAQVAIALENSRLYHEAQQRLLEQRILFQIGNELNSIFDYDALMEAVVFHMAMAVDTTGSVLYLLGDEAEVLNFGARYISRKAFYQEVEFPHQLLLSELPTVQQNIIGGTSFVFYANDETTSNELSFEQQAVLSVPLVAGGRSIGVLCWLEDREPRQFGESKMRLAQTLANQVAMTLDHSRLYNEMQYQLQREVVLRQVVETTNTWVDQDAMLEQFAAQVNQAMNAVVCTIYAVNEGSDQLESIARHTVDDSIASSFDPVIHLPHYPLFESSLHGEEVLSFSLEEDDLLKLPEHKRTRELGFASMIFAPLAHRGRIVGVLEIFGQHSAGFSRENIKFLEALANPLATSLDNNRLYQEEHRQRSLLEGLQRISQTISSELDEQTLLNLVAEGVYNVFEVDAVAIVLKRFDDNFSVAASQGLSEDFVEQFFVTRQRVLELLGDNWEAIHFDSLQEIATDMRDLIEAEELHASVLVPLVHGQELLGLLSLAVQQPERQFTRHEREMTQLLGRQVAITLNNARLFELQKERTAELVSANRLKTEFLANVSHEFRTPLSSIIGFSDSLLTGIHGELTEKQRSRLDIVLRNAYQLQELIDNLIDLANIDAGRAELTYTEVSPREIVMDVVTEFTPKAEEKSLTFTHKIQDDLPMMWSDPYRLNQIFKNLISNAIKFTHEGGLHLEVQKAPVNNGKNYIYFMVADTGIGIAPEDQEFIFDAFRQVDGSLTREFEGTGMGLSVTYRLVKLLDGEIKVESEVGQGTIFHVFLPQAES